ncbi:MAG: YihY/virulence factor BrkB family protein [Acidisphaera sp.]|nr:YihY/virulence factor BrkB family protein [Acidisphaera sp.]
MAALGFLLGAASRVAVPGERGDGGSDPQSGATSAGRDADSPSQIPARGWWAILKRVAGQFSDDRIMAEAAGIIFFALLAIFPAIAALVSLYGLFADPATVSDQLSAIAGFVPGGGMDIIKDQVTRVAANGKAKLGFGLVIGLGTSLWSANQGIKALFDALNVVYHEPEKRSFFRRTLLTLAFTAGSILFVLVAMGAVVVLPILLNFIGLGSTADVLLRVLRWPLLLVAVSVFLSCVYRWGPSRAHAKWRWVSWGGTSAAVLWVAVSLAFSWYVANFGSYNKTYGSLGAAVGFMTWIWISAIVVLMGAELDAEMEHQTAADTTTGAPRPMGVRGATKADQLAAA